MISDPTNYSLIADALRMYERAAYERISYPWDNMFPPTQDMQPDHRYMAVVPRTSRENNEVSRPQFIELQLFHFKPQDSVKDMLEMVEEAKFIFKYMGVRTEVVPLSGGGFGLWDLVSGNEMGSYNMYGDLICGTGLAEPRLSLVLERNFRSTVQRRPLSE